MAIFDNIIGGLDNFKGYTGNPPTTKSEYDSLSCWKDKSKAPTWEVVSADMALEEARAKRQTAYPSVGDQLDMIYKDNLNGTTTHKASVEAVKAKYPKP